MQSREITLHEQKQEDPSSWGLNLGTDFLDWFSDMH